MPRAVDRLPKVRPGTSVSREGGSSGTIGCIVEDEAGHLCILSNAHVLDGISKPGSGADGAAIAVVQPGVDDLAFSAQNVIGATVRAIRNDRMDVAIARLNASRQPGLELWGLKVGLAGCRMARVGEVVMKAGRTTRLTYGRVASFGNFLVEVDGALTRMEGMMIIPRDEGAVISAPGDSGSVWFSPSTFEAVGLHVSGGAKTPRSPGYAIACHLPAVLRDLKVTLTTSLETLES